MMNELLVKVLLIAYPQRNSRENPPKPFSREPEIRIGNKSLGKVPKIFFAQMYNPETLFLCSAIKMLLTFDSKCFSG